MWRKTCACCGLKKPANLQNFVKWKHCRDEVWSYCRPCGRKLIRDWKKRNRDRLTKERRDAYLNGYSERHKQLERERGQRFPLRISAENLLNGLRGRCNERRLPRAPEFRNKKFLIDWLARQPTCECCGVELVFGRKRGRKLERSPSLDQVVAGAGYLLPNVALICWRCNNIKRNYDVADLTRVALWLERKLAPVANYSEMEAASDYLRGAA